MTTVYLAPGPFGAGGQFFGLGGLPLNLGTITTYAAGTTTPLATYTTSAGSVQNANPIVLGTDGRPPNEIWVTSDFYRLDLKDSLGNLIKTYDNLGGAFVDAASLASTASPTLGDYLVGVKRTNTGATATTVHDFIEALPLSVKDFGAVGDGTTDDTTAIQAAVTTGRSVFFPNGTYKITTAISLPDLVYGQKIYGESMERAIIAPSGVIKSFVSTAALVRVHFSDLAIIGNSSTSHAIDLSSGSCFSSSFRNLWIYVGGKSIYAPSEFSCVYDNINFSSYNNNGIEIQGSITTTLINCYGQTFGGATAYAYRIYTAATLIGCNGVNSGYSWGLFGAATAKGDTADALYNITFIGCNIEAYSNRGVQFRFDGSATFINTTFITCTLVQSATYQSSVWVENCTQQMQFISSKVIAGGSVRQKLAEIYAENGSLKFIVHGISAGEWASADMNATLTTVPTIQNKSAAFAVNAIYFNNAYADRYYGFYQPVQATWTADSATFDITSLDRAITANTGATGFTNATTGVNGQRLSLYINDANTTIRHAIGGAGQFQNWYGVDIACASGEAYLYQYNGSAWRQIGGLPRRARGIQGAAVTAANNIVLGEDGSYYQISGATQINLIDNTHWWGGAKVTLKFSSTPTVKHNQAASGNNKPILLAGAVDFVATANDTLTLVYDSTDVAWYEVSRAVI